MGLREDVEDLKAQIRKSVLNNNTNEMAQLLRQAFSMCEKIRDLLKTAGMKERAELSFIMQDFRKFLNEENGKLSKKMGLSEEELRKYNEDPRNFTKEQWAIMEAIKKKFSTKTKEIRKAIKEKDPLTPEGVPENWRELIANNPLIKHISPAIPPRPSQKKKPPAKRTKKSKWMKS